VPPSSQGRSLKELMTSHYVPVEQPPLTPTRLATLMQDVAEKEIYAQKLAEAAQRASELAEFAVGPNAAKEQFLASLTMERSAVVTAEARAARVQLNEELRRFSNASLRDPFEEFEWHNLLENGEWFNFLMFIFLFFGLIMFFIVLCYCFVGQKTFLNNCNTVNIHVRMQLQVFCFRVLLRL